ncbi:CusA/CzcA family heavy metal efflux RND transporter [Ichthyobacterium seriolicida]|uniref:Heat-shock protein Hsp70 n=1 Tax=Ichthyobacterium seriolicida TaxID=242600 RepID=A0A1J1E3U8_9FLAO|nr:CusA/CzcA family heavy metal efflux RND transporter [Ichthyobacterium seriolicida]BAV94724.1 heat-shock protein Hsp70 [Ichthyobacterium seriolicida]
MFNNIIAYSVKNKFIISVLVLGLVIWGVFSLKQLPIDAVPDITNNQVQIITVTPTLATQEVEQFITTPIELSLQALQKVTEIRSISRFGLSVITVVFDEKYDVYLARQLVGECLKKSEEELPKGLGAPEIAPISTGLGEIYQYVLRQSTDSTSEKRYSSTELRSIQDWIVKRQLLGIEGVAEVNSMGGFVKQYEISINPHILQSANISIIDILEALEDSNENTGGAYIEKTSNAYYIRSQGVLKSIRDIENTVITVRNDIPILIKNIATVNYGEAPRYGALVRDGQEVVGGKVMMFKGANASKVTSSIKERVEEIQKSLPKGVVIEPYLVRDTLVKTAIGTVKKNLIEGSLIVIFILVLLLGNWKAGLIVASIIPLSMLFAIAMMNLLGISANLMSLGAIDFGLVVDGSVIIVESIIHRMNVKHIGKRLTQSQMDDEVIKSSQKIRTSATFGEIIILIVYIPILALVGIEGKMFKPMAQTVMLAISGALILSLTYVPMMASVFLSKDIKDKKTIADKIMNFCYRMYTPVLDKAMEFKSLFIGGVVFLFFISLFVFSRMGSEFIPTLEEGDLALQQIIPPGSSLSQSIDITKRIQKKLLEDIPEIKEIVSNIGSAEIPTDPMPVEIADYIIIMQEDWLSNISRKEMFEKIEMSIKDFPGVDYEFSQPIQLRFNELMTGTKADIAIKLFGDDLEILHKKASEAEQIISAIEGVGTVNVEQTIGMPQIIISFDYEKMAQYGLHVKDVNKIIRSSFAGEKAGVVYEGEKKFDMVVRLDKNYRANLEDIDNLFIPLKNGRQVSLGNIASVDLIDAPMQISRENTNRRIVIGVNVGNTDIQTLVNKIKSELDKNISLPVGYYFRYGGQFENLREANERLAITLPIALGLILILLYLTFNSISQAFLIFTSIPLSAIGGIYALLIRDLPFSVSAGIGFIALFGVSVLNGIVLIGYFNQLKREGVTDINQRISIGTKTRLRPVLMTAIVASLGFLPMAISTSGGAEVQRPLATVVIGGLISATFLTLVVLPILYFWLENRKKSKNNVTFFKNPLLILFLFLMCGFQVKSQTVEISLDDAVDMAVKNHPSIEIINLEITKTESLSNLNYNLGTTDISYEGDNVFNENDRRAHQISITQNFPNLGITTAHNTLQREIAAKSLYEKEITENELKRMVKKLYMSIQYKKGLKKIYTDLSKVYEDYFNKSKSKLSAGNINAIEKLIIESKFKEYLLMTNQIDIEISSLEEEFRFLLNTEDPISTKGELDVLEYNIKDTESSALLKRSKQNIAVETARADLLKNKLLPNLSIGYSAINSNGVEWSNGIRLGINIPIFNNIERRNIDAKITDIAIASELHNLNETCVKEDILKAQRDIMIYKKGIEFYEKQMKTINSEIIKMSNLNYETGNISYIELLNSIDLAISNNCKYLKQILEYNNAVADYQFITNQ